MSYKNKSKNTYIMNNNICENCIKLNNNIDVLNTKISQLECDNQVLNSRITCLKYDNDELRKENYIKIKDFYIIYNKNKSKIYFY